MISNHDRSYYIGASDTGYVLGNWNTRTFEKWYLTKLGLYRMDYTSEAMMAGTAYEHRILDSLGIPGMKKDTQIIRGRLRVNLDGNTEDTDYEVKTYRWGRVFKPTRAYRDQVQVELYASGLRQAYIVAYGLEEADYKNFYREIVPVRRSFYPITYDEEFIMDRYLPRLEELCRCLDEGRYPKEVKKCMSLRI